MTVQQPHSNIAIRPYRGADREAVVRLWDRCGLLVSYNDCDRDIALWRASPNAEIFLAERKRRILGSVCVGHDGHRGMAYYLAVDPKAQGRGIGRRLMRHAEAWLTDLGVVKINLMIREDNAAVSDFYRAIGYQDTPRRVMARWLTADAKPPKPGPRPSGKLACTITYLEMTERPTRGPAPLPHGLAAALLRVRRPSVAFYRFLYNSVGADWLWYERRALDDTALRAIIEDEGVEIFVLYVEGAPAGFAELDRRRPPDIELAYFGLLPAFMGRGLGAYLLGAAVECAWAHEPERLWLHTNSLDHPKALSLYQRHGFKPYKQEQKIIDDPRLTGLFPETTK